MRRAWSLRSPYELTWPIVVILLAVFIVVPAIILLAAGFWSSSPGAPGHFTFSSWMRLVGLRYPATLLRQIENTLVYAAIASAFSVVLGIMIAYFITSTNIPFRNYFERLLLLPRSFPILIAAIAWTFLASPQIGFLNTIAHQIFGFKPFDLFSFVGMAWIFMLYEVPTVALSASGALKLIDPYFEDAARACGASSTRIFFTVTMRLLSPLILSLWLLMFLLSIAILDIQVLIGIPANIYTTGATVFYLVDQSLTPDYNAAAALGLVTLVLTVGFMIMYLRFVRVANRFASASTKGHSFAQVKDIGKWRYVVLTAILAYLVSAVVLPGFVMISMSLTRYIASPSLAALATVTSKHWVDLFGNHLFQQSLVNSLILAFVGATLSSFLALLLAHISQRAHRGFLSSFIEIVSMLPLGLPSIMLALAYIWFFIRTPIYDTLWILLAFYVFAYIPTRVRIISPYLLQIPKEFEEASLISGRGQLSTLRTIILPLLSKGFLTTWILSFQLFLVEFAGSIILVSFRTQTLSTAIYTLAIQRGDLAFGAVAGTFILILSTVVYSILLKLGSSEIIS